jgi:hypothetical protein
LNSGNWNRSSDALIDLDELDKISASDELQPAKAVTMTAGLLPSFSGGAAPALQGLRAGRNDGG